MRRLLALATAPAERFSAAPIDHSTYETVRDLETLDRWIADARETGLVGFDTETTSLDPMQAELCGVSLAIAATPRTRRAWPSAPATCR
jgi:DNA polymerase-1